MQELNKNRAGLILGSFLGLWHLTWSLLVATGTAQVLLDWIYYLHFLNNPFHVADFNVGTAALLIVITSVIGYVFGWVLALLWNMFHRKAEVQQKTVLQHQTKPA
jgi:heme/copper-type cytochrome/quinol oxidase subunit 4